MGGLSDRRLISELINLQDTLETKIDITHNLDGEIEKLEIFQENLNLIHPQLCDQLDRFPE